MCSFAVTPGPVSVRRVWLYAHIMVRFTVLASGSKGNSTVVCGGQTRILVDAGLSCRELFRRMRLAGEAPETLDAQDPRLELAARELSKLKPDDLERLLKLLAAMRSDSSPNGGDR